MYEWVKNDILECVSFVDNFAATEPVEADWKLAKAIDRLMREVEAQGKEIEHLRSALVALVKPEEAA